jgi:hypothetical protein
MTRQKTTGAYRDCQDVLDAALREGSITVEFDTSAQATQFRHRCYKFRSLLLRNATAPVGLPPSTPYDELELVKPDKGQEGDHILTIRSRALRSADLLSRIRTTEGAPIELPNSNDETEAAVRALRSSLGLDLT